MPKGKTIREDLTQFKWTHKKSNKIGEREIKVAHKAGSGSKGKCPKPPNETLLARNLFVVPKGHGGEI